MTNRKDESNALLNQLVDDMQDEINEAIMSGPGRLQLVHKAVEAAFESMKSLDLLEQHRQWHADVEAGLTGDVSPLFKAFRDTFRKVVASANN